ncbi:hypothetical protein AJ80_02517 [Polytolypa hystricis UAMH7299]|uniref:6-phosphogluconolactonase n=1 Tax=Polytolypa hystricis (strain UAMH7299) TaxID=1447883 RepID=A0A2B7YS23_POLH7|nr:hypothetical protein AJ80_02517 [Polytolypa hystricis UAMH7299]
MPTMLSRLLPLALLSNPVMAASLYASHYSGTVSLLTLTDSNGEYSLTETSTVIGGGTLPSWLTWDSASRTLYSNDERFSGTGSLTAFSAAEDGALSELVKVNALFGGVASTLYGGDNGTGFIATAHYQASSLSTFKLPLTPSSTEQQTFEYELTQPGTNPWRQEAPHPHHVVIDPTGSFLLLPDLGADLLRIYSIDKSSGQLTACSDVATAPGSGPRHAAFWSSPESDTRVFVADELRNTVSGYTVTYANDCPSFELQQVLTPYENNATAPAGTKAGEIRVKDNSLYLTNRNDKSFNGNDSITQFTISSDGSIAFHALTSSHGTYPRTFDINQAGDLAAIGDQTTANVAIVLRDTTTGELGDKVADLRIGAVGTPESEDGVSAVIWAE